MRPESAEKLRQLVGKLSKKGKSEAKIAEDVAKLCSQISRESYEDGRKAAQEEKNDGYGYEPGCR